jgi:hypothetical protein
MFRKLASHPKQFLGRSAVAMPFKGALCKMAHPNQDMQVVDVDVRPLLSFENALTCVQLSILEVSIQYWS